jgi:hypothetical protein
MKELIKPQTEEEPLDGKQPVWVEESPGPLEAPHATQLAGLPL